MPDDTTMFDPTGDEAAERDARWRRVVGELRREPSVRPGALDEVMAAVLDPAAGGSVRPIDSAPSRRAGRLGWLVRPRMIAVTPLHAAAALVLAAVALGAALVRRGDAPAPSVVAAPAGPAAAAATGTSEAAAASRTVQFVFVSGAAREVSLVGDFNDWQTGTTPLRRASPDGLWTVEVPLEPGRYTYAFVVDGTRWVPDDAAPRAPDDEFGGEKSVLYVRQDT
ncbi:MAG TPA: isoamylase early set domain-containing protein [Gemmatimonadaceae bacterium]